MRSVDRLVAWLMSLSESQQFIAYMAPMVILTLIVAVLPIHYGIKILLLASMAILAIWTPLIVVAFTREFRREFILRQTRSLDEIRLLKWSDFETFVAGILGARGYQVVHHSYGGGADGGVDLIAIKGGKTTYVQCKHHSHDQIGPEPVRSLYGVMARDRVENALFVTSGVFAGVTEEEFADCDRLTLVDGSKLARILDEIKEQLPEYSGKGSDGGLRMTRLLVASIQTEAEAPMIRPPRCQKCGETMVLLHSTKNRQRFWGCPRKSQSGCKGMPLTEKEIDFLDPYRSQRK